METDNAKGSARLLHLSLANSCMVVGEEFVEDDLKNLLFASFTADSMPARHTVLLYPMSPPDQTPNAPHLPAAQAFEHYTALPAAQLRLVVLDGTWRKSRKMLHLNPLLQQLPRLSLQGTAPSRYTIRKAHAADQLSTLEATCAALAQLEGNAASFTPLLQAFDGFVAQQAAMRIAKTCIV